MESFLSTPQWPEGGCFSACTCKLRTVVKIRLSETFPSHVLSVFVTDLPVIKIVVDIVGW